MPDTMTDTGNWGRVADLLAEEGADWAVLSGFDSVCFATGHISGIETGPSPFGGGPALAFVGRDGTVGLVCSNTEGGQTAHETIAYPGFANAVTDQLANYRAATAEMIARLGVSGRIAVEHLSLPAAVAALLPGTQTGIDTPLARLRAVKTAPELARLRFCAEVAAEGQRAARALSRPGSVEIENFGHARAVMEAMADARVALAGEYITGVERTATLGLPLNARILADGDPVLCDLAPRVAGYWGDSCASYVVGGHPSAEYEAMYAAARDTLTLAIATLRPGLRVCDFDANLRAHMAGRGFGYPHHSGHGIGTSVHEWPRLVPDETAAFEQDMVIMVEPGSYVPGLGGLRCEYMLHVTATGAEVMAHFEMTCK